MVRGYSTNSLLIEPWVRIAGGGVDEHELFLSATAFGVGDNGVAEGAGDDGRRHSWVWSGDVVRGSTVSATVASLQGADGRASSRRAAADTSSMSRSTSLRPISTRRRIIKGVRALNHRVTETYTIEHSGSGSYRRDGDRRGWRQKSFFVDNASFVALDDDAVSILSVGSGRDVVDAVSCGVRVVVRDARARDCEALVRLRFSHRRASALRRAFRTRACPPSSLVLHVAEDCNMRCGYCYADFGRYGGEARLMTAVRGSIVDAFFDGLDEARLHVTFFGGEPLLNVPAIRAHAHPTCITRGRSVASVSRRMGPVVGRARRFFRAEGFALTVSIDGAPRSTTDSACFRAPRVPTRASSNAWAPRRCLPLRVT